MRMRGTPLFLVLSLGVLFVGAQLPASYGFNYPQFRSDQQDSFYGGGCYTYSTNEIDVCRQSAPDSTGYVFWKKDMFARGFVTNFTLLFGAASGQTDSEGIAFVVSGINPQSSDFTAAQSPNGMGYGSAASSDGMKQSFAFEFDIKQNPGIDDNYAVPHVSIHASGSTPNDANENTDKRVTTQSLQYQIGNTGKGYLVEITYEPMNLDTNAPEYISVLIDGGTIIPRYNLNQASDVADKRMAFDKPSSWIGFTSGNARGNNAQIQRITSWGFEFLGRLSTKQSTSTASVQQIIAGEEATLTIQDKDQYGNPLPWGRTSWIPQLEDEETVVFHPSSNNGNDNTGVYTWTFTPRLAHQNARVTAQTSSGILGSPQPFQIVPASPQARSTRLINGPSENTPITAGISQAIVVTLYDQFGNPGSPGDPSKLTFNFVSPPNPNDQIEDPIEPSGDRGTITALWSKKVAGVYHLTMEYDNTPFGGTSTFTVSPAGSLALNAITNGPSSTYHAGESIAIDLQLRDPFFNTITTPSTADQNNLPVLILSLNTDPSNSVTANVQYMGNGVFRISQLVGKAGWYSGDLVLTPSDPNAQPFKRTIQVWGLPGTTIDPTKSILQPLSSNALSAGNSTTFQVDLRDAFDNEMTQYDGVIQWKLTAALGDGTLLPAEQVHINQTASSDTGTVQVEFSVDTAASYQIQIYMNEQPVGQSFAVSVAPGKAAGAQSTISSDAQLNTRTGDQESFVVYTKDKFGNARHIGGDDVKVIFTPPDSVEKSVNDTGDSTYAVQYKIGSSGDYQMRVTVNGEDVQGSPFTVRCKWAGLSTGAIIGIALGVILFIVIVAIAFFLWKKKFHGKRLYQRLATDPDS